MWDLKTNMDIHQPEKRCRIVLHLNWGYIYAAG